MAASSRAVSSGEQLRLPLEAEVIGDELSMLPLTRQRWFASSKQTLRSVAIVASADVVSVPPRPSSFAG